MIIITCGCAHSWVFPTTSAPAWSRAIQHDPCPSCGNVGGTRFGSVLPDPDIRTLLADLESCGRRPGAILSRSVSVSQNNTNLPLVTVVWRNSAETVEVVCEVDRRLRSITKMWVAGVEPNKGRRRRTRWVGMRGLLHDLIMTLAMGQGPVTDWQAWVSSILHNADNQGTES